jgi:hypothetical protein
MTTRNKPFTALALAIPAFALAAPAMAVAPMQAAPAYTQFAAPVFADSIFENGRDRDDRRYKRGRGYDRDDDHYDDRRYERRYDRGHDRNYRSARYDERISRDTRIWRGRDGRYHCQRDDGTTGLLIGAAVGGLIGNEVAGRGDRTLGAILGAAGGAILGRSIDRSNARCR